MGLRKAVRDARREDKAGDLLPIHAVEVDQRHLGGARLGARILAVVPGPDLRARRMQRPGGGQTRFAEAEHGHRQIGEEAEIDTGSGHRDSRPPYLSLRRSEEHTSELQSLMRTSYAVLCLK